MALKIWDNFKRKYRLPSHFLEHGTLFLQVSSSHPMKIFTQRRNVSSSCLSLDEISDGLIKCVSGIGFAAMVYNLGIVGPGIRLFDESPSEWTLHWFFLETVESPSESVLPYNVVFPLDRGLFGLMNIEQICRRFR